MKTTSPNGVLVTASVKCRDTKNSNNTEYEETAVFSKEETLEAVFDWVLKTPSGNRMPEVRIHVTGRVPPVKS